MKRIFEHKALKIIENNQTNLTPIVYSFLPFRAGGVLI